MVPSVVEHQDFPKEIKAKLDQSADKRKVIANRRREKLAGLLHANQARGGNVATQAQQALYKLVEPVVGNTRAQGLTPGWGYAPEPGTQDRNHPVLVCIWSWGFSWSYKHLDAKTGQVSLEGFLELLSAASISEFVDELIYYRGWTPEVILSFAILSPISPIVFI